MDAPDANAPKPRRTAAQRRAVATNRKAKQRAALRDAGRVNVSASVTSNTASRLKAMAAARGYTVGQAIDACTQAADTAAARAAFRATMSAKGYSVTTLVLKAHVEHAVHQLAREHRRSAADVIELGVLVARRELQAMAERQAEQVK
jgi:hypothetical protein